jgi:dTDP-4-amino-4,6-dideoxygalactose transaminase
VVGALAAHFSYPVATSHMSAAAHSVGFVRRKEFLPFAVPLLGPGEEEEVIAALRSGWITTGPRARKFETAFQEAFNAPAALALNSCSGALHVALAAIGVGPGDEVITTTMTFAASVNCIIHMGATPVLVDVEPDTLNIDPARVEAAVTARTKAIIPVHYAGHPVDLAAIQAIATRHGLHVVEDAAHAVCAKYKGQWIGSGANLTAFSFYATKNLTTGEGGMLTGDPELVKRARMMALHGISRDAFSRGDGGDSWKYEVEYPGFKYNITDMAAAMGLVQLRNFEALQARRAQIVQRYNDLLGASDAWELPTARPEVVHAWHLYVLKLNLDTLSIGRDEFFRELGARNIGASVHFIPIHTHPYYRNTFGYAETDFPVAWSAFQRIISIPLHPGLSDQDVDDVAAALLDIVDRNRR